MTETQNEQKYKTNIFKIDEYQKLNVTPNNKNKYKRIQSDYDLECEKTVSQLFVLVKPIVIKKVTAIMIMNSPDVKQIAILPKKYQQKVLDNFVKEV